MTERLTQMLKGHGCFNWFLRRIRKLAVDLQPNVPVVEPSTSHPTRGQIYGEGDNTSHTLLHYVAFERDRNVLIDKLGHFGPGNLIVQTLGSLDSWKAVVRTLRPSRWPNTKSKSCVVWLNGRRRAARGRDPTRSLFVFAYLPWRDDWHTLGLDHPYCILYISLL